MTTSYSFRRLLVLNIVVAATIDSSAAAVPNRPVLSITLRDGDFTNENYLDYFCPTISAKYSTPGKDPFPVDIQYGYFVAPSTIKPSISIWGKASQNISDWRITAGAALAAVKQQLLQHDNASPPPQHWFTTTTTPFSSFKADVDIRAHNPPKNLSARIFASDLSINRIEFTKGFTLDDEHDTRVTINPRYNPETNQGDIIFGCTAQNTSIKIRASTKAQEVSIAQQINENNVIIPTITNSGDVSVRWERQLSSSSSSGGGGEKEDEAYIATTLKPSECIHVEWKDGLWHANMNIPIDNGGGGGNGMHVGIRREVVF